MNISAARAADSPTHEVGARVAVLFEAHGRMVYGLCRLLLRDPVDAEDATQESFLSAQRSLLSGHEPRDPAAWLAAIARNECRARIREGMRAPLELVGEAPAPGSIEHVADRREEVRALCEALGELPEQQRNAIVLREFYGLSYEEAATALGVSHSALESLLFRARGRLQTELRPVRLAHGALVVPIGLREGLGLSVPGFASASSASSGGAGLAAALAGKLAAAPVAAKVAAASVAASVAVGGATVAPPARTALEDVRRTVAHAVAGEPEAAASTRSLDPPSPTQPSASPTPAPEAPLGAPGPNEPGWPEPPPDESQPDDVSPVEETPSEESTAEEAPPTEESPDPDWALDLFWPVEEPPAEENLFASAEASLVSEDAENEGRDPEPPTGEAEPAP